MLNSVEESISDLECSICMVLRIIAILSVSYLVVNFIVGTRFCEYSIIWPDKPMPSVSRVLFVTAHPDDECMFFGPTIVSMLRKHLRHTYLLCLSPGNYDGKGIIRKQELWDSCSKLGILPENVTLLKNDHLKDGEGILWMHDHICPILLRYIHSLGIDTLITFDDRGVSGHSNHVSIFKCVNHMVSKEELPSFCRAYVLQSVGKWRKYLGFLYDVPFSYHNSEYFYTVSGNSKNVLKEAMAAHISQLLNPKSKDL